MSAAGKSFARLTFVNGLEVTVSDPPSEVLGRMAAKRRNDLHAFLEIGNAHEAFSVNLEHAVVVTAVPRDSLAPGEALYGITD